MLADVIADVCSRQCDSRRNYSQLQVLIARVFLPGLRYHAAGFAIVLVASKGQAVPAPPTIPSAPT